MHDPSYQTPVPTASPVPPAALEANARDQAYASYMLQDPIVIADPTDIPVDPALLRHAVDFVTGALSVGPIDTSGTDAAELYRCLPPSSWFRVTTAILASIG